jgi:two-component system sensor histidine kinase KdpD
MGGGVSGGPRRVKRARRGFDWRSQRVGRILEAEIPEDAMSDELAVLTPPHARQGRTPATYSPSVGYSLAVLLVAAAAVLAFVTERVIVGADVSLIFVLPVVISAVAFGWGPALAAGIAGVLAFDFFFTAPRYSLNVAGAADVLSLTLLMAIAAVVSTVAAQSRQRALAAAAAEADTLELADLARACAGRKPQAERLAAAAAALSRMFDAPAVIYARRGLEAVPVATAGDPAPGAVEQAAASWVMDSQVHARAETYPHDASKFDIWPLGEGLAAGVDFIRAGRTRPDTADALVGVVAALLAGAVS